MTTSVSSVCLSVPGGCVFSITNFSGVLFLALLFSEESFRSVFVLIASASRFSRSERARFSQCKPCTRPAPRLAVCAASIACSLGLRDIACTSTAPHRAAIKTEDPSCWSGSPTRTRACHCFVFFETRVPGPNNRILSVSVCFEKSDPNADAGAAKAGIRVGVAKFGDASRGCVGGYLFARSGHRNTAATAPAACASNTKRGAWRINSSCARQPPFAPRNTATAPTSDTGS
mmetsp:Transcript_1133/g.4317  ORF Transcript_1133/g.4317 Transcript_1133/m.4317 type:complete len:231 (-) Transcript_1133:1139-1831(-)